MSPKTQSVNTWLNVSAIDIACCSPKYIGTNKPYDQLHDLLDTASTHLLVTVGGTSHDELAGIISRRDLSRALIANLEEQKQGHPKVRTARDIMSPFDASGEYFHFILESSSLFMAIEVFIQPVIDIRSRSPHTVSALPVMHYNEPRVAVGIVTIRDVFRYLSNHQPQSFTLKVEATFGAEEKSTPATLEHTVGSLFSYFAITKTKILPIVDNNISMRLLGTVTDLELYNYLASYGQENARDTKISDILQPLKKFVTASTLIGSAINSLLDSSGIDGLAVVESLSSMRLVGVISPYDILKAILHYSKLSI